jgi:uncharacterized RDD family membrane protein YckC
LGAFCADLFFAAIIIVLVVLSLRGFDPQGGSRTEIVATCWALAGALYLIAFFRGLSLGQTLGKAMCGLRVVDKRNGSVPGIGRMLLRETLAKWVSGFFLSLGYFWAIWDRDGQTWHDKIAGTVVLHEEQSKVSGSTRLESPKWWAFAEILSFLLLGTAVMLPSQPEQNPASVSSVGAAFNPKGQSSVSYAIAPTESNQMNSATEEANPSDGSTTNGSQQDQNSAVIATISGWASAEAQNNPASTASYYAEQVDRYFLQRNVTREFVQADKQSFLDSGKRLQNFRVDDLQFESSSPEVATVVLIKYWVVLNAGGTSVSQGSTRSRLWLEQTPDGWKITGEQDLK